MNHLEAACERLKEHYNNRTPIYWELYQIAREENAIPSRLFAAYYNSKPHCSISQTQLIRLFRAVKGEFGL